MVKLRPKMAVCPHEGLDLPTTHLELIISKMVYWLKQMLAIFKKNHEVRNCYLRM